MNEREQHERKVIIRKRKDRFIFNNGFRVGFLFTLGKIVSIVIVSLWNNVLFERMTSVEFFIKLIVNFVGFSICGFIYYWIVWHKRKKELLQDLN